MKHKWRAFSRQAVAEEATAADDHDYVNGQRSTSEQSKLKAAEVQQTGLRAPDEIRHGRVQLFEPRGTVIIVIN